MDEKVRIARRILAGDTLSVEDYQALGYDTYKFSYYGQPDDAELRRTAEHILREADADIERRIGALEEQVKKMKDALAFLLREGDGSVTICGRRFTLDCD